MEDKVVISGSSVNELIKLIEAVSHLMTMTSDEVKLLDYSRQTFFFLNDD